MGLADVVGILDFDCWPVLPTLLSGPMESKISNVSSNVVQFCEDGAFNGFVIVFQSAMGPVLGSG